MQKKEGAKMKRTAKCFVLLMAVFAVSTAPLYADSLSEGDLSFPLDFVYAGTGSPQGSSPWLTATFQDLSTNSVQLTLEYSALPAGGTEYVSSWFFNFNPSSEVLGLSILPQSEIAADPIIKEADGASAGGGLSFDLQFSFAANSFNAGETSTYLISSNVPGEPVDALSFNFLSTNASGLTNYYSAANIQGVDSWIAAASAVIPGPGPDPDPGPKPVPEPATIMLLGFGLSGLIAFSRKKFFA